MIYNNSVLNHEIMFYLNFSLEIKHNISFCFISDHKSLALRNLKRIMLNVANNYFMHKNYENNVLSS